LFTVLVGYETLHGRICELAHRTPIPPAALVPWLDQALIERVVFDAQSRVINVGVKQRLFRGATRRAVEVRDQECFNPYCDLPADRCQIDHIIPYQADGPTHTENGRPACGHHNRTRPRAGPHPYQPETDPDGYPPNNNHDNHAGADHNHAGDTDAGGRDDAGSRDPPDAA
jgi:hypothetical protein